MTDRYDEGFAAGLEASKSACEFEVRDYAIADCHDGKAGARACLRRIERLIHTAAPQAKTCAECGAAEVAYFDPGRNDYFCERHDGGPAGRATVWLPTRRVPVAAPQADEADEKIVDDIVARNMPSGEGKRLLARSEEQVRAEERRLCRETVDRALRGHSPEWSAARVAAVNAILAIGSGHPLEEVMAKTASEVASWPEWRRSPDTTALGPAPVDDMAARLAAAEDRVRVLEGALGAASEALDCVARRTDEPNTAYYCDEKAGHARAALAKKPEGT